MHGLLARQVGIWLDDFGTSIMSLEGTFDEAGKVLTLEARAVGSDPGSPAWKMVDTLADANHRTTVYGESIALHRGRIGGLTMQPAPAAT